LHYTKNLGLFSCFFFFCAPLRCCGSVLYAGFAGTLWRGSRRGSRRPIAFLGDFSIIFDVLTTADDNLLLILRLILM